MVGQMIQYGDGGKFNGYLAKPAGGGPGVLVLHAWWGLNDVFKSLCDRLAGEGFVALAPDLFKGSVATTIEGAEQNVHQADDEFVEAAVREAADYLVQQSSGRRLGALGFSFGGPWAVGTSLMKPDNVAAVVLFYSVYAPDLSRSKAAFLGHFAENDAYEPREGIEELRAALQAKGLPATFYIYEGTTHWFFEPDRPDAYAPEAAKLAWERTVVFLRQQLSA